MMRVGGSVRMRWDLAGTGAEASIESLGRAARVRACSALMRDSILMARRAIFSRSAMGAKALPSRFRRGMLRGVIDDACCRVFNPSSSRPHNPVDEVDLLFSEFVWTDSSLLSSMDCWTKLF